MKYNLILLLLFAFLASNSLNLKVNATECRHLWREQEVLDIIMMIGEENIANRSSSVNLIPHRIIDWPETNYDITCILVITTQNRLASEIRLVFNDVQPQENRQSDARHPAPLRQRPTDAHDNRNGSPDKNIHANAHARGNRQLNPRHAAPLRQRPTGAHARGNRQLNPRHAARRRDEMPHEQMDNNHINPFNVQAHHAANVDPNTLEQKVRKELKSTSFVRGNQSEEPQYDEKTKKKVRNMLTNMRKRIYESAESGDKHDSQSGTEESN